MELEDIMLRKISQRQMLHVLTYIWKLKVDFIELESRIGVTRGWERCGGGEMKSGWVMGTWEQSGRRKDF
jgi:hypothetical protein